MIKVWALTGTLLAVCVGFACGQNMSRAGIYIAPELKISSTHTIDDALREPFPNPYVVTVGKAPNTANKTLSNCLDYLAMKGNHYSAESSLNLANVHYLGAKCDALDWIRGAKPAARPAFQNFSWRQIMVRQLPPELALNISREEEAKAKAVSAHGGSIAEMEPGVKLRIKSVDEAELVAAGDWTAALTVEAHGDFLGDGNEELLVVWLGHATGGTYTASYTFLLGRAKNGLVVVQQRPSE